MAGRIETILSGSDFKLFFSGNYNDGYKIAARYLPDIIIIIRGIRNEGPAPLKNLCSDEALSGIPVLIISEDFSVEELREVMNLGADDYMPAAFLENSLLNSIEKRLEKITRIKQHIHSSIISFDEKQKEDEQNDHILVKIGNKLKFVEYSDIVCITALKEYSKIITKENLKIIVRKSLRSWIRMLPAKSFLRIHRATIININYIDEIIKTNERTYTVHLKCIKESFDFSHRYANLMRRTFPT